MNIRVFIYVAAAVGIGLLIWFLAARFPGALESDIEQAALVRAVAILAVVGAGVVLVPRTNLKGAFKHIAIWLMIGVAVVVVYVLKDDVMEIGRRIGAEVMPFQARQTAPGTVEIKRGSDGHFRLDADVDGTAVRFLVDTGASIVTLSRADAERVGLDPGSLDYVQQFSTASGTAWGAPVRFGLIGVGDIAVENVRAAVLDGSGNSLLGMSFLGRLSAYSVSGDTMTLRR